MFERVPTGSGTRIAFNSWRVHDLRVDVARVEKTTKLVRDLVNGIYGFNSTNASNQCRIWR